MTLVQKLLLGGVPTVAAGGTGVGVILMRNSKGENGSLNGGKKEVVVSGIKVGDDAAKTSGNEDLIREAGLNCGDGKTAGKVCGIGSTGLNVDKDNKKKEGLFPVEGENGNIKFWLSNDTTTYTNKFRFTVIEKPIKLQSKDKSSETITLDRYENYGLVKDNASSKVYLTRKHTAEEGIRKSLGLPDSCTIPTTVSTDPFKYDTANCEPTADEIKSINFDGKKAEGATSSGKVKLYIHKVNDTKTFKGGYKFTFHPYEDIDISDGNKLIKNVWWDFRIKDPDAESLVLERVWKNEDDLLNTVGLTCNGNSTCTIKEGSLKIKVGTSTIENGKKKTEGSTGTLYLEKNRSGHYEGLRFTVWGGGITIESASSSQTTLKMEETEIFHISKEDKNDSSYYLTLKHDVKEMILYLLGLNNNNCSLPDSGASTQCTVQSTNLGNVKLHNGNAEQKLTGSGSLSVTITAVAEDKTTYPFGYKFSLKATSGEVKMGETSLSSTSPTDFKIKKDDASRKLYLEKVEGK